MTSLYQMGKVNSRHFFTFSDIYQSGKCRQHSAMTNAEIRLENARWLAAQCGGPKQFADMLELSESRVSQLIGKNPIKNIGTAAARKIEVVFKKPEGWLDTPHAWVEEQPQEGVTNTSGALVNTADLVRLIALFGEATESGRSQILRMAEGVKKTAIANPLRSGSSAND